MKGRLVLRYLLAVALVGAAFGLKMLLEPVTGTGAPFVLFFGAVVAASLWAGPGPGICAALLSIPLGAYGFVACLQPDPNFGRILAAYGGIFVAGSLAWGVVVDRFRPDLWDLIGAGLCLIGVAVIMYAPRGG